MAIVLDLPYLVIKHVIDFQHLKDIINISKVLKNWKIIASKHLKTVRIDDSTVYGGSWQKYYEMEGQRTAAREISKRFAHDLANCTDKIEHLYFDGNCIPQEVFEILLSSQKALKTLVVLCDYLIGNKELAKIITEGLIRHENSLEKVSVEIEDVFPSFKRMADAFRDKNTCFPNLKSMQLSQYIMLTPRRYDPNYYIDVHWLHLFFDVDDDDDEIEMDTEHLFDTYVLFRKILTDSRIAELNFKSKMPVPFIVFQNIKIIWSPPYTRLLTNHFRVGAFSNLKKINIDCLNTGEGTRGEFSESDADLLIKSCPHISHIDSDYFFSDIYYRTFDHDEKPFIKIIKHYGPQLVHIHCSTNTNIAKCIIENCPNVKTLTIVDYFGDGISDSALFDLSNLKKLKKLTISFWRPYESSNALLACLGNCVSRLTKLQIILKGESKIDVDILKNIKENGKNLQTLVIDSTISLEDHATVVEALTNMLSGCTSWRTLSLHIGAEDIDYDEIEESLHYYNKIIQMLINYHTDLSQLGLCVLGSMPNECKQTLTKAMPYCKLELFTDERNYYKF